MVCATTFLAYSKDHVFASRPTCVRHIVLWYTGTLTFFFFFYLFFLILYFFSFEFLFLFLFIDDKEACDISHDVRSQAQSRLEWTRWMMSRSILTACLPYNVYMVYSWMMHGLQGRVNIKQHRPHINYINRVAIQQGLLVEFSCDLHINSLLRALLLCVIIGLCVQWLPQHIVMILSFQNLLHPFL